MGKGRVVQTTEATLEKETALQRGWPDYRKEVTISPHSLPPTSCPCLARFARPGVGVPKRRFTDGCPEELRLLERGSFPLSTILKELGEEARCPGNLISKLSQFVALES